MIDHDLITEFPRIRTQLRQGRSPDDVALKRLVRQIAGATRPELQRMTRLVPPSGQALRAGWLANQLATAAGCPRPTRPIVLTAGLLADLHDDPRESAALLFPLKRWPAVIGRLIRQQSERINGVGVPSGLVRSQLSIPSQVLGIAVEAARRLSRQADAITIGQSIQAFGSDSERLLWDRELVAHVLPIAFPLVSENRPPVRSTTPLVRIDAKHEQPAKPKADAVRSRRLTGLRASAGRGTRYSRGSR